MEQEAQQTESLPIPMWLILVDHYTAIRCSFDNKYAMDFRVYSVCEAFAPGDSIGRWELIDCGKTTALDDWENGFAEIDGSLKWDGCINWQTNPEIMMHGCGPGHAAEIVAIFQVIYAYGKRHLDLLGDEVDPMPDNVIEMALPAPSSPPSAG